MPDEPNTGTESEASQARFTPEQVERMIGERLKRDRIDHGQIDELRQQAEQVPRLQARIQTLERERDQARQDAQHHSQRADTATLRAEVVSEATRAGAVDPDDVFRLLPEGAIKLEEGKPSGVEEAVRTLAERKAHLFAAPKPRPSGGDGGARDDGGRTNRERTTDMNRLLRQGIGLQQ